MNYRHDYLISKSSFSVVACGKTADNLQKLLSGKGSHAAAGKRSSRVAAIFGGGPLVAGFAVSGGSGCFRAGTFGTIHCQHGCSAKTAQGKARAAGRPARRSH